MLEIKRGSAVCRRSTLAFVLCNPTRFLDFSIIAINTFKKEDKEKKSNKIPYTLKSHKISTNKKARRIHALKRVSVG